MTVGTGGEVTFCRWCSKNGLRQRLQGVADTPFKRLSYTEAIELLQKAVKEGHVFEDNAIEWGIDMGSEHERCASPVAGSPGPVASNYSCVLALPVR